MRKRRTSQKKMCSEDTPTAQGKLEDKMKDIELKLLQSHENQRIREEMHATENIKTTSEYFFSYANRKLKNVATVGPLTDENGILVDNPREMAQIFKKQYENVFSTPDSNMIVTDATLFFTDLPGSRTNCLSSVTVSSEQRYSTGGQRSRSGPW